VTRQDDLVKAMALENHIDLAADFVAIKYGIGDAETDGHEFDGNNANFSILGPTRIVLVDLGKKL
jgi:hypothetical protein